MINESYDALWTNNERGYLFEGSATLSTSTTADTPLNSYVKTGDSPVYIMQRELSYSGGNMTVAIIEDSTLTVAADNGVTCLNRDRPRAATFEVGAVTSVDTLGTTYARQPRLFLQTSTGQPSPSNFSDSEFIKLKPNTTYHLQVTPAAASMTIASTILFYDPSATLSE